MRIDGYVKDKLVISKSLSGRGVDRKFLLIPDDVSLMADGADTTRVVLRVTDEFGAVRAIWIRAGERAGNVRLTARHPQLGVQTVDIVLSAAKDQEV